MNVDEFGKGIADIQAKLSKREQALFLAVERLTVLAEKYNVEEVLEILQEGLKDESA
jgi:hypothetical protein